MTRTTPPRPDRPLTVGAVVGALADEFPDVTISKVRFLEAEGLVVPARSASGYRQYTPADVERVRYVLRAQRDRFLPLRVIREHLEAVDRGLTPSDDARTPPSPPAPAADPAVPSVAALVPGRRLRLTRSELAAASGLDAEAVEDLLAHGMLRPDADGLHGEPDLQVAHAAAGLAAHGVEPRHLRALRTAAERQAGLVEQVVGPRRDARTRRAATDLAHLFLTLHAALVRGALAEVLEPPGLDDVAG